MSYGGMLPEHEHPVRVDTEVSLCVAAFGRADAPYNGC